MELAQLHEAGSSQAEQRTAAEEGVEAARRKVEDLEDVVREQTTMYEESNGEPRDAVGRGGWVGASCQHVGPLSLRLSTPWQARVYTQIIGPSSSSPRGDSCRCSYRSVLSAMHRILGFVNMSGMCRRGTTRSADQGGA